VSTPAPDERPSEVRAIAERAIPNLNTFAAMLAPDTRGKPSGDDLRRDVLVREIDALIRTRVAEERERCAKVCDDVKETGRGVKNEMLDEDNSHGASSANWLATGAFMCAAAIRALPEEGK
jgi:hypothetical protein